MPRRGLGVRVLRLTAPNSLGVARSPRGPESSVMSIKTAPVYSVECDDPTCPAQYHRRLYTNQEQMIADAIEAGWKFIGRRMYCPGCKATWGDVIGVIMAPTTGAGARGN